MGMHDLYRDGRLKGRVPSHLAGTAQLRLSDNSSCGDIAFVLKQTSSLKFRTASQVSSLVCHAVSL
jgi:hypothetical protein